MYASTINWQRAGLHALVVGLLLWALIPDNPYGYYLVMRWIVSAVFLYLAISAHEERRASWAWVWAVTAGIYNPIVPVHATRELWSIVNVITIGLVIFRMLVTRKARSPTT